MSILLHRVLDIQVVLQREVEESIKRVGTAHLGDFGDGLALVILQRRIGHFKNLDAMPLASEQMRPFQILAEFVAKLRIGVDFLLHLDRLIERTIP
jgi:hypothetical protein